MMLASDSSCGGLEADMAVAVGGSLLDPDGAVAMLRRQACQTDFGGWPISEGALLWIPSGMERVLCHIRYGLATRGLRCRAGYYRAFA